jgi:excisionase family DNA binding protein
MQTKISPQNFQNHERWLSVEEIASYLGVKRDTIYKWINRKKLPCIKVGRLWKAKVTTIDKWVENLKSN